MTGLSTFLGKNLRHGTVRFTFDGIRAILSSLQYTVERGKICVHLVLFSPILTRKVAGLPVDPFVDPPLPFNPSHATRTQELLLSSTVLLYCVFYVSILSFVCPFYQDLSMFESIQAEECTTTTCELSIRC